MLKSIMNSLSSAWSSKESKAIMLTYEEARARITEVEFNRLAEAFQRAPTTNGYMSKFVFSTDIGEMFPTKIVDCIYVAFGGTSRGILFKDLIAGLVLLTKGTTEEKIRFIFCMYSQDNTVITRDDLTRFTEEIEGIEVPDPVLNRLFQFNTHIEFDEFFVWLSDNPVATSISAWLLGKEAQASSSSCIGAYETSVFKLTDDHDAPTFYQTLAGVTHLEEEDIIDLEKRYWSLHSTSRTGKMDLATLFPLVSPPLPESIVQGFMDAFDENRDGHIDFKEMACGISAAGRGPALERQKFCFKIFDQDKDGVLSVTEVAHMVSVMKLVARENMPETPTEEVTFSLVKDDSEIVQEIWQRVRGEAMTVVEYLEWSLTTPLPDQFLALIYQVCQVIFGLKPLSPSEEYEVVTAWLAREEKRGFQLDQILYLVSMDWWKTWLNYVNCSSVYMSNSDSGMCSIIGSSGSQSNSISSFSESNGNGGNGNGINGNSASSSKPSRCWSLKKSNVEASVATDNSQNVVVTGINSYDMDRETGSSPTTLSPNAKSSSSSLSLVTMDSSSRSTCSSSPSPINSPGTYRRHWNGSSLTGKGMKRRRPEAIDNSSLIAPTAQAVQKVQSLTSEGGRVRRDIEEGRDFKVVPRALWIALLQWYGSSVSLPRKRAVNENDKQPEQPDPEKSVFERVTKLVKTTSDVVMQFGDDLLSPTRRARMFRSVTYTLLGRTNYTKLYSPTETDVPDFKKLIQNRHRLPTRVVQIEKTLKLELWPLTILLYRHQGQLAGSKQNTGGGTVPWTGMAGMYGGAALSTTMSYVQPQNISAPKRVLSYTASFSSQSFLGDFWQFICNKLHLSMQDTRLDLLFEDLSFAAVLEEENSSLQELGVRDMSHILIEVRNKDQTWPEEIGTLANNLDNARLRRNISVEKGLTGLNNLGNTCFMNAAVQCVSNTVPLTQYFRKKMHMFELNRTNPLGMKGHIAKRYGDLITDIWSGTLKTIAPFKLRWTIGKYAPRFSGFQQHDAQELLSFLLDGLHEDLNRVTEKPYVELKDSNNRPDVVCAQEAWENHLLRNKSIVVDLFHGQLKSTVRCNQCLQESIRFDPFNYLSLPLPMECFVFCDVVVIRQNGAVPIRYGILANIQDRVYDVKIALSAMTSEDPTQTIDMDHLVLVQTQNFRITGILRDTDRVKGAFVPAQRPIYAFQVTPIPTTSRPSNETEPTDQQIQKILTSSKNTSPSSYLRAPVETKVRPTHSRTSSFSGSTGSVMDHSPTSFDSYSSMSAQENILLVVHRKMMRQDYYFIASQKAKPNLFGLPLVVPYNEGMTHLDLYKRIWALVARLISPLPPADGPVSYNHAQDCDDSLGYEFPFKLRLVLRDHEWCCGKCSWFIFCRGCPIMCTEDEKLERFHPERVVIAIDWDPTALHLRYQTTHEFEYKDDPSVRDALHRQSESVALTTCLDNFTKQEELSEDEKYYCSKCETHQLASKKLQIWRLPPFLIVHLKRFQPIVGNKWIKSNKVVSFPVHDFNPGKFLATIPQRTMELALNPETRETAAGDSKDDELFPLQDFHQHRLYPNQNPFELNYRLYACVCHSGILGGGHYISYARNAEGKWYCYNDSSCKEITEDQIDKDNAYMLFYERVGLDGSAYMPRIDPRATPIVSEDEMEAEENDLKKQCVCF